MFLKYIVCDRCAASVAVGTGALVLKHADSRIYPSMHLCDKCFHEVFPSPEETVRKVKGQEEAV